MVQQRALYAGVMTDPGGPAVVPSLPEADLPLIDAQSLPKGALCEACKHTGGAELAAGDEV